MKRRRARVLGLIAAVWVSFLVACGLPGDLKKAANGKIEKIALAGKSVLQQKTDFIDLKKTDRFAFFAVYADRENWEDRFRKAEAMLQQAEKAMTTGRAGVLLKANQKDKAGALRIELAKVDRMMREAVRISREPAQRMAELERIRNEAPQRVETAERSAKSIRALMRALEEDFIPKAQKDYPKRAGDIRKRFAPLERTAQEAEAALAAAREQLDRHQAGQAADYAVLGASTDQANKGLEALNDQDKAFRAKISELYQSYTKILEDMRIDHFVTVGRVSWDEDSDFWQEHNYIYPPGKVSQDVYAYFTKLNPKVIPATYSKSWGGQYRISVRPDYWKALSISPTRHWPSRSDDLADFWIEEASAKAYHRYTLVQNGERQQTDWVEVDEEEYYDNFDFLGMEIVSKPYGVFEEEKVKEASPPGMAFVGDSRYGEWRTDHTNGRSFWYYYGIYSFLNRGPGGYYYRGGWDRWQRTYRNRKPYYGGSGTSGPIFGTYGTHVRTDGRYRNTDFARKGGLKTQAASVRGAGPARRGGGPGGKGK